MTLDQSEKEYIKCSQTSENKAHFEKKEIYEKTH